MAPRMFYFGKGLRGLELTLFSPLDVARVEQGAGAGAGAEAEAEKEKGTSMFRNERMRQKAPKKWIVQEILVMRE